MLARMLFHLVTLRHPVAVRWLQHSTGANIVECLSMSGGAVQVEAKKEDLTRSWCWSDEDLLTRLQPDASAVATALVWTLCRFCDVFDETDRMLHDYIKNSIGLTLEPIPFTLIDDGITLLCDRNSCSGTEKPDTNLNLTTTDGVLRVVIPYGDSGLRELLLGRLRRITI